MIYSKYSIAEKKRMDRFWKQTGGWLIGLILFPMIACGNENPLLQTTNGFPRPYIFKDRGMGSFSPQYSLNQSGMLPEWLSLSLQQRTRYETLNHQFRSRASGSDQVLSLRTLAQATLDLHADWKIQLEFQDSRAEWGDTGTAMSTAIVNAAELLEANLQWLQKGLFQGGSRSLLRAGRLTMDIGKRRLVARNRFRNTKNAFTGLDWIWQARTGTQFRALLTLPVIRQPSTSTALLDNEVAFDKETFDRIFWGIFISTSKLFSGDKGELYVFGLHEQDAPGLATRNRQLITPGFRWYQPQQKGQYDYEWESVLQFGQSRATTATTDTRNLDHFSHFHHVEIGYSFLAPWSPRLVLAFDYASGDDNPADGRNGRFDPLFGATVFDFGPTSIHRAFIRSNITGPGVKFIVRPHSKVTAYLHYRAFWLASDTDVWAGNSGLQGSSGNSDSFLGHQIYLRGIWQAFANAKLEFGFVYRISGDFQETAPNSPRPSDSLYSYASITFSF
jgi:hypothetical protein